MAVVCFVMCCGCGPPSAGTAAPKGAEYSLAGFDQLAGYTFEMTDDLLLPRTNNAPAITADAQIPAAVKALDQKRVALRGFMLPLKVEGGLVTELLVMKDQSMCCYGSTPKIHEWVSVKMTATGVKPVMDQIVTLYGTFHVGEQRENGYLISIYRMDGEKMVAEE
jgi:hypothetical protein